MVNYLGLSKSEMILETIKILRDIERNCEEAAEIYKSNQDKFKEIDELLEELTNEKII
jgi:hypothetical protein